MASTSNISPETSLRFLGPLAPIARTHSAMNCQSIVKKLRWLSGSFCLLPLDFPTRLPQKIYACCLLAVLIYLFQHHMRIKFEFVFLVMPLLFSVLDVLSFGVPLLGVFVGIGCASFFKTESFLLLDEKMKGCDEFLGERYGSTKKICVVLVLEFVFLVMLYVFYFFVLSYMVDMQHNVHLFAPHYNFSYCLTVFLFLLSIFNIHAFIMLLSNLISGTNLKLTKNLNGALSFCHHKGLPRFFPTINIHQFLIQYRTSFELIRLFNDYYGFQLLFITATNFIALVNNMYLSTLKVKNSPLAALPPHIIFFRHLISTSLYLVTASAQNFT